MVDLCSLCCLGGYRMRFGRLRACLVLLATIALGLVLVYLCLGVVFGLVAVDETGVFGFWWVYGDVCVEMMITWVCMCCVGFGCCGSV